MAVPKSVVKIRTKKGNVEVELVSSVDYANYTIIELTRAAMRDVGKFVVYTANNAAMKLHGKSLRKTKRARGKTSTFRYSVPWAKNGDLPHVECGVVHDTWYGVNQELGSSKMPKLGILTNAAKNNIKKIIEIESAYLNRVCDESAEELIDENETIMEGASDENS